MGAFVIYDILSSSAKLLELLGDPLRAFPFGDAPQGVVYPYVTWQTIGGRPENYLGNRPDMDVPGVQFDVWAQDSFDAEQVAKALEYAIETECHVTAYNGTMRDPQTMSYRVSFTTNWHFERPTGEI